MVQLPRTTPHEDFKARLIDDVFVKDNQGKVPMDKVIMLIWQFRDDPTIVQFMAQFVAKVRFALVVYFLRYSFVQNLTFLYLEMYKSVLISFVILLNISPKQTINHTPSMLHLVIPSMVLNFIFLNLLI